MKYLYYTVPHNWASTVTSKHIQSSFILNLILRMNLDKSPYSPLAPNDIIHVEGKWWHIRLRRNGRCCIKIDSPSGKANKSEGKPHDRINTQRQTSRHTLHLGCAANAKILQFISRRAAQQRLRPATRSRILRGHPTISQLHTATTHYPTGYRCLVFQMAHTSILRRPASSKT